MITTDTILTLVREGQDKSYIPDDQLTKVKLQQLYLALAAVDTHHGKMSGAHREILRLVRAMEQEALIAKIAEERAALPLPEVRFVEDFGYGSGHYMGD